MEKTLPNAPDEGALTQVSEVEAYHDDAEKNTFADLGLGEAIVSALNDAGIGHPFEIQDLVIPAALKGHDIVAQAKTGTGKTFAFALPAVELTRPADDAGNSAHKGPQTLIIAPTRELATQITNDIKLAAKNLPLRIAPIYGGTKYESQIKQLQQGTDIVVGTPGRLLDLYKQEYLQLNNIRIAVLDEADEMLDLGFLDDVGALLSATPKTRQTMLFSATMPGPIVSISRDYMQRAIHIHAMSVDDEGLMGKNVRQLVYRVHSLDKDEIVGRILQARGRGRTIIFTQTKRVADKVKDELEQRGFAVRALHGDLNQQARERSLAAFRKGSTDVLVATDIAARGIDIDDITHVINYQVPEGETTYIHRIGRTARAGSTGVAVTFVDWDGLSRWSLVNKALGLDIPDPQETYSTSPHLFNDLDIPQGTKGYVKGKTSAVPQNSDHRGSEGRRHDKRKPERRSVASNTARNRRGQERTVGQTKRQRKRIRTVNGEIINGR